MIIKSFSTSKGKITIVQSEPLSSIEKLVTYTVLLPFILGTIWVLYHLISVSLKKKIEVCFYTGSSGAVSCYKKESLYSTLSKFFNFYSKSNYLLSFSHL